MKRRYIPDYRLKSAKKRLADAIAVQQRTKTLSDSAAVNVNYWNRVVTTLEGQQPPLAQAAPPAQESLCVFCDKPLDTNNPDTWLQLSNGGRRWHVECYPASKEAAP